MMTTDLMNANFAEHVSISLFNDVTPSYHLLANCNNIRYQRITHILIAEQILIFRK